MYCPKCGEENKENATACNACGEGLQIAEPVEAVEVPGEGPQNIPNYLAQSILVTLFCCLPLGIPAIVFAAQVNGKVQSGDIEGAMKSSRLAKTWSWWSFGIGLLAIAVQIVLQFSFFAAAESGAY